MSILQHIQTQFFVYAPRVFCAVVVLILLWFLSDWVKRLLRAMAKRLDVHQVVMDLLAQIASTTLIILGIICALGTLGINVTALVASLGLAGFALGFALKDILSNTLSGVMLLYHRPFWIGDRIKVTGHEGAVRDITLRYTVLDKDEGEVLIPNSSLLTNSVEILNRATQPPETNDISAKKADENIKEMEPPPEEPPREEPPAAIPKRES